MSSENNMTNMRRDAADIFSKALQSVEAGQAVRRYCKVQNGHLIINDKHYDLSRFKRIFVIGAGKASAAMGGAIEELVGDRITKGMINVKYDHLAPLEKIRLTEAGHPVPDQNGENGAKAIFGLAESAKADDLVISLFSGGGSALLPLAYPGLTLAHKQETSRALLACGATIHEINAIRKHTSMIKGGRLARAASPAEMVSLILSDVVGDDLDVIASGPAVPDSSTFQDCMEILNKYDILSQIPGPVINHIRDGIAGKIPETPKQGDPAFHKTYNVIVGSGIEAITVAKQQAEELGYNTLILSSLFEGETKDLARFHGAIAKEIIRTGHPVPRPACILSGGETTVTIQGNGLGGRNQEFVLALGKEIAGKADIVVLSGGTDGTDGPTDAAGAIADTHTIARAGEMGMDPRRFLSNNDSYHFFKNLDDLLITGPTNTNVMDLRMMLIK